MRTLAFACSITLVGCSSLMGPSFEAGSGTLDSVGLFGMSGVVSCPVKNTSGSPAPATITFKVRLKDGTTLSAEEYVMLQPKEPKTVTHEFTGVAMGAKEDSTVTCRAVAAK